jgi:hypothetical protein
MAKTTKKEYQKLQHSAYQYIVEQGMTQKETSALLKVSETTLSAWASKGGWRELRRARQSTVSNTAHNIKQIIAILSERKLTVEQQINDAIASGDKDAELELRREASRLSDDISKQNKALSDSDKTNRITLGMYIDVMDDIFSNLRAYNEELYLQTIDFQVFLNRKKTNELG